MLIVLAEATLGAGALEEARVAFTAMIEASREEEGCISYAYAIDVLDRFFMQIELGYFIPAFDLDYFR